MTFLRVVFARFGRWRRAGRVVNFRGRPAIVPALYRCRFVRRRGLTICMHYSRKFFILKLTFFLPAQWFMHYKSCINLSSTAFLLPPLPRVLLKMSFTCGFGKTLVKTFRIFCWHFFILPPGEVWIFHFRSDYVLSLKISKKKTLSFRIRVSHWTI